MSNSCFLCCAPSCLSCPLCNQVWACSTQHLSLHCSQKDKICFPYTVRKSPEMGRYLVASRDVKMGEVLYEEEPLVVAPNAYTTPICLACLAAVDCSYLCEGCGYPVCDQECASDEAHKEECKVLSKGDKPVFEEDEVQDEAYHVVMPLRLLLLLEKGGHSNRVVELMVDHTEERRGGEYWIQSHKEVVVRLREGLGQLQWKEEDIHGVVGRLEMNSYEIHSYGSSGGYRAMFPISTLVNHSCLPNCVHIWTKEAPFTARLVARRDIAAGDMLTVSYLPNTMCSLRRRPLLKKSWYFQCVCARCESVDEAGSQTNTLVCMMCSSPSLVPTNTQDWEAHWSCSTCGHKETHNTVRAKVEEYVTEAQRLCRDHRYDTEAWLEFRARALKMFHPRHEVLCEVAKWVAPVLARGRGLSFSDFPRSMVEAKVNICGWYLGVLDIVEAGLSRNIAKTMFEMVDSQLYLDSVDFRDGRLSEKEFGVNVKTYLGKVMEMEHMMSVLGTNTGYEEMVVYCLTRIKERLENFLQQSGRGAGARES